jgi:hypothetical protein
MPSPLSITFSHSDGRQTVKGPFARLRLEGEVMRAQEGGEEIARHERHHWQVDGLSYTRAECTGRATLNFLLPDGTSSKHFGPFDSVSFVDGIAYADRRVFAFADRSIGDWYCHENGHHYPLLVIEPAG